MRGYFPELKFLVKVKVESNLSNNAKKKKSRLKRMQQELKHHLLLKRLI